MTTLKDEKRSIDVKAKRLRREGFVTGNVFGREIEGSIPVKVVRTELDKVLKTAHKGSQIMLDVEGQQYDVLIKEIDHNPLAGRVDEIDFQALVSNEKVHSVAEVVLLNRDSVVAGVVQENLDEIAYKAYPSALVDKVEVDVSSMKIGDTLRVKDLEIAKDKDIDLITDPEAVVATVTVVKGVAEDTETTEETEEAK